MNNLVKPVITCQNLYKTYSDGLLHVEVLRGINLSIAPTERLAIVGASGSGKSTLLHLLGGLDKPSQGDVQLSGIDINRLSEKKKGLLRNQKLGFVYQFHHLLPEFNALENVAMPLLVRGDSPKYASDKAAQLLDKVGLSQRINHRIGELSGGERQRVAIARALVTDPDCVLADEPTGNLDQQTANKVIDLMLQLNAELKTSLVIVTHDTHLASRMDRTITLQDGILLA